MEDKSAITRNVTQIVSEDQYVENLENHLRTATLLNVSYLKTIRNLEEKMAYLDYQASLSRDRTSPRIEKKNDEQTIPSTAILKKANDDMGTIKNSYAFRVGDTIVNGFRRPGKNTLLMPFRLTGLVFEYFFRRR
jgi:hypothetical protein